MPNGSRALAVTCLLALIVLGLAWELWLAPTGSGTLALKVLPLLAALPGLWQARLVLWLYVGESLVRVTTERAPSSWLAALQLLLCLLLFAACALQVRAQRRLREAAP